ncbi:MAG: aminotransferase class V-fold PLP-dependent enzyme [Ruminococcaceae bacterium]|nr:aminotransferase class V-fold PLP-dependent enzyme [Oscillospiraceae bacterium]
MIYLDNAATSSPKPESVIKAMEKALRKYCANPGRSGHKISEETAEEIYKIRRKVADFFGCSHPENVVFLANCTQAINIVLKGILRKNDHFIISNLEHNAVARPSYKLGKNGTELSVFNAFAEDIEEELERVVKSNTRLIFCIHASNVCGKVLPIEKIGEFCKQRGILFGVDAAQSAGIIPIDMEKNGIDFLCIAAHKGLFAPMGTGILIANSPINNTLLEGGNGANSMSLEQGYDMPEMLESGTVNVPGIFGIGAGIDYIRKIGINNILSHEIKLCEYVYNRLKNCNKIKIYWSQDLIRTPVISLAVEGVDSGEIAAILNREGFAVRSGYHCSPFAHKALDTEETGTVRISPGITNNRVQMECFCKAILGAVEKT